MARKKKPSAKSRTKTKTKKQTRKGKKNKTSQQSWLKRVLLKLFKYCFVLGIWFALFLSGLILWYAKDLDKIKNNAEFEQKTSITFLDRNEKIIARYGGLQGEKVAVFDLQPHTVHAILAVEDRRFYLHGGVDYLGIARAAVNNVIAGRTVQGGSTLTQQLAKNLFLSHERSFKRKIQEFLLAHWLEDNFTKDEILTAYINRVYFGSGAYGIESAAQVYFNKPAKQLNLNESALIAGLLKAPSRYSPKNNPSLALSRMKVVLKSMADAGYISPDRATKTTQLPPLPFSKPKKQYHTERYFTDWLNDQIPDLIGNVTQDVTIHTTLDMNVQKRAELTLQNTLRNNADKNVTQGAILITDDNGAVIAMIGGANYASSQFNRATQAKRQPGSTFKTFVYLSALEKGWRSDNKILDGPFNEGSYRPKNFKNEYAGDVSLNHAFINSLNTPAVRLINDIGFSSVISVAKKLGISSTLRPESALALGASETKVIDMHHAYLTISENGRPKPIHGIVKITSGEDVLYNKKTKTKRVNLKGKAIQETKALLNNAVNEGTGKTARIEGIKVFGKTGTSQNYRDAWFIGFTNNYTATVWLGNDDNSPMKNISGGMLPAQIWKSTIEPLEDNKEDTSLFKHLIRQFNN